jgi:putative acyl-CoA dehydrogenase
VNPFLSDELVAGLVRKRLPSGKAAGTLERLSALGELCGGRLGELVESAHQDGKYPRLRRFDRWGERVDEIEYCAEQREARRLAMGQGVLPPTPLLERMTKAYLLNQLGEGGVTCPLAMTDGLVQLLEAHGTPAQKKRWLPLVLDADGPTPLTGGQFVTEKQGGSNVSANETRAVPSKDGSWRLTGLKWFCSNPGELWVTTAKPEGTKHIALFLVPRRRLDGSLNECHILRLKDLSGTRGKATAEVEYKGAYAELIGRPSQGLAILMSTVIRTSRIHVAAGSLGMMRRALVEARTYSSERLALGKPIAALPLLSRTLAQLEEAQLGATLAFFEMLDAIEKDDPSAEVLIPLLKIAISEAASRQVREARLILAGNGMLRDFSILPRLAEDALIQETWEGTRSVLAAHVEKALRKPASKAAFEKLTGTNVESWEDAYPALTRALVSRYGTRRKATQSASPH